MGDADIIVVGAGLSGLVAAAEAADAGRTVLIVDQEPRASLGGQAWWSFGGLFFVNSPEQRRMGVKDSVELALSDWMGTAAFDRPEDHWPRKWAEAYVNFAAGEKRSWLREQGLSLFPVVQWAERGGYVAGGHGNSVPRFHVTWGTGPGVLTPFVRRVMDHVATGKIRLAFRHRVVEIVSESGAVVGVSGEVLAESGVARGEASSREVAGVFDYRADAVIVASGGIGANHDLVRANWPAGFGEPPANMLSGVPDSTDGLMLGIAQRAGAHLINPDRMWHYPEGIENHSPVWSRHGIRILSGPSPLWVDARGQRLPPPLFPGFDALGSLRHITATGYPYSWLVLDRKTIGPEFALSGSEQNPDLTGKSVSLLARSRLGGGPTSAVQAFLDRGVDFLTAEKPFDLAFKMNALTEEDLIDPVELQRLIELRDGQIRTGLGKDPQITATAAARRFIADRRMRTAPPHEFLDPAAGPLIAVRCHILTRKTLGGLETNLDAQVLSAAGDEIPGLYAVGEAAGFGGGGMHGYRSLEGTFLGGCLFSGRTAGRAAAQETAS